MKKFIQKWLTLFQSKGQRITFEGDAMNLATVKELLEKADEYLGYAESHASLLNIENYEAEIILIRERLEKLLEMC